MKQIILTFFITLFVITNVNTTPNPYSKPNSKVYVYICKCNPTHVFHSSKTCKGLSNCTQGIIKTTVTEAMEKYHIYGGCRLCNRIIY